MSLKKQILKTQRENKQKAFTLLEMLVSVIVFSFVATIAYSSFIQIMRSSERISESNQTLSELQFALAIIEKDVLQLTPRKIRDQYGDEEAGFILSNEKLSLSRLGWENFIGAQRSHIQRVEYSVVEDQLVRSYWMSLDQGYDQKPIQTVLLNNVNFLSFSVLNNALEKKSTWPLALGEADSWKVKAIEIKLDIKKWGEITKLIELVDNV